MKNVNLNLSYFIALQTKIVRDYYQYNMKLPNYIKIHNLGIIKHKKTLNTKKYW